MLKIRTFVPLAAIACAATASPLALATNAGENPQEIVIDFEGIPESTRISNQYADLGVTFGLAGSNLLPIICTEGAPPTAFGGYDGSYDTPAVSGVSGLTDPPGNSVIDSYDLLLTFEKPVKRFRVWVLDIDGGHGESWLDTCTVAGSDKDGIMLDKMSLDANDPGTGDLAHTLFEIVAPDGSAGFSKVLIDVADSMGYAIDDVAFTLMADDPGPGEEPGGGGDGEEPGGEDPPSGGNNATPGVNHHVNPIGQETLNHTFVFGRGGAIITTEPDGGMVIARVPFDDGGFDIDPELLPCGVPVYWTLIGTGPRGNTVRMGSKLDPIIRRPFGDLTLDGVVDTADLSVMIDAYLTSSPIGDLNNDGLVDTADLGLLIGNFRATCHD
ncbi:MAG: hypothetical protein H6814_04770 [Phycisphaeraceae bacterium]|nr:hypothetical protein [Phycisphaeraceae bacterium]